MIYWNVFDFTWFSCSVVSLYCERERGLRLYKMESYCTIVVVIVVLPYVANYPVFIARYLRDRNREILNLQIIKTEQECCVLLWALFIFIFLLSLLVF